MARIVAEVRLARWSAGALAAPRAGGGGGGRAGGTLAIGMRCPATHHPAPDPWAARGRLWQPR